MSVQHEERKEEKTVSDIIEEVKNDMCDHFCIYPRRIKSKAALKGICEICPLNRL